MPIITIDIFWIQDEMPMITCDISIHDFASIPNPPITLQQWVDVVIKRLREAKIPIEENGVLSNGTLQRFDDPKDFSKCTYEWSSTKE